MLRPLELNLASRPFRNNTLLWLAHGVLAAAVVGSTAWNTVTFLETGQDLDDLRSNVGSVQNRLGQVEVQDRKIQSEIAKFDLKYLTTQTVRANQVIARKRLSWTRLFNLLESVQPYEVRMVSIRPVFGAGLGRPGSSVFAAAARGEDVVPVNVEGSARDLKAFLEFERALIGDPHFDRVEPERTSFAKNGEVLFGLAFLYFPAGRESEVPADQAASPSGRQEAPESSASNPETTEADSGGPPSAPVQQPPAGPVPAAEASAADPRPDFRPDAPAEPERTATSSPGSGASAEASGAAEQETPVSKYRKPKKEAPSGPIRKRPDDFKWDPLAKQKTAEGKETR